MEKLLTISQTPTITASSAYTNVQALGGLLTFSKGANLGASVLLSVCLTDKDQQNAAIDFLLFSKTFTATADKASINISAADMANCIGVIKLVAANYSNAGGASVATVSNQFIGMQATADSNIYGQLVSRGTPTYTSTSAVTVKLSVQMCEVNA